MANASAPIQYRAIMEVVKLADSVPPDFHLLPMTYRPALELAMRQSGDGIWNHAMLTLPSRGEGLEGVGTINALDRKSVV